MKLARMQRLTEEPDELYLLNASWFSVLLVGRRV